MPVVEIALVVAGLAKLASTFGEYEGPLKGLVQAVTALFTSVQQVQENQKTWTVLANRSHDVVVALSQHQTDAVALEEQVDRMCQFHQQIHLFYKNEVEALHKVERVFKSIKIRNRIEQFNRELEALWQGVMLALAISTNNILILNEADLRRAVQQDETQDQVLMKRITSLLQQNNDAVLDQVGIRLGEQEWKIRQATDSLQHLLKDENVIRQVHILNVGLCNN
jgi:hypothetical protein